MPSPDLLTLALGHLPPRLKAAFPAARAQVQATPELLGLVWSGSAAAGQANDHSDLDFYALVSGTERWRESFAVDGVPVEAFYNAEAWHRHYLKREDASSLYLLTQGVVLVAHPLLTELRRDARAVLARGRTPEALDDVARHTLTDLVWEARSTQGSSTQGTPMHAHEALTALGRLTRAHYAAQGWWDVKPKHWPDDLVRRDPALATLLRSVLEAPDSPTRQAALERYALAILGRLDPVQSVTARQAWVSDRPE